MLPQQARSLVAVSGGQDSLCLIHLLLDLQPKWGWQLAIAHCNHRWRSDADANAEYVQHLAHTWQLPYYEATADVELTSEATARQWRYTVLVELAQVQGYTTVVTGHTASDRTETLLYNLIRGSGSDGLQALTWQRQLAPAVQLVRPLLTFTRSETAQYCQDANLNIWQDSTNQDWRYARNRIRQELLPYLQTHFNPQAEQTLAQTAELLQAEVEYLEAATDALWHRVTLQGESSSREDDSNQSNPCPEFSPQALNRFLLRPAPLALQRRVVRRFLQHLLPASPNFEQIEKVIALLAAPNRSQTDPFPGGAVAQVEGDWIRIKMRNG